MNSDDILLRDFAETYPYSFDELKDMLSKQKPRRTAESLISFLKNKCKSNKESYL